MPAGNHFPLNFHPWVCLEFVVACSMLMCAYHLMGNLMIGGAAHSQLCIAPQCIQKHLLGQLWQHGIGIQTGNSTKTSRDAGLWVDCNILCVFISLAPSPRRKGIHIVQKKCFRVFNLKQKIDWWSTKIGGSKKFGKGSNIPEKLIGSTLFTQRYRKWKRPELWCKSLTSKWIPLWFWNDCISDGIWNYLQGIRNGTFSF